MNINLGDKNKIKNSNIGHQINSSEEKKKGFAERHPILTIIVIPIIIGFFLLFSFWEDLAVWIESFFK